MTRSVSLNNLWALFHAAEVKNQHFYKFPIAFRCTYSICWFYVHFFTFFTPLLYIINGESHHETKKQQNFHKRLVNMELFICAMLSYLRQSLFNRNSALFVIISSFSVVICQKRSHENEWINVEAGETESIKYFTINNKSALCVLRIWSTRFYCVHRV